MGVISPEQLDPLQSKTATALFELRLFFIGIVKGCFS
jgi:hypothetical protein